MLAVASDYKDDCTAVSVYYTWRSGEIHLLLSFRSTLSTIRRADVRILHSDNVDRRRRYVFSFQGNARLLTMSLSVCSLGFVA